MPTVITNAPKAPAFDFVAFAGPTRLAAGGLAEVATAVLRFQVRADVPVVVFNRLTGEVVDLDLRGGEAEVLARYSASPSVPRRGRPNLGVVAREVTLLPRHWDWLRRQPGGASTTLRRLVEAARKTDINRLRERVDAAYRLMAVLAGDLPGFEEAARSLFAGDRSRLDDLVRPWPQDIRDEVLRTLDGQEEAG